MKSRVQFLLTSLVGTKQCYTEALLDIRRSANQHEVQMTFVSSMLKINHLEMDSRGKTSHWLVILTDLLRVISY